MAGCAGALASRPMLRFCLLCAGIPSITNGTLETPFLSFEVTPNLTKTAGKGRPSHATPSQPSAGGIAPDHLAVLCLLPYWPASC